MSRGPHAPGPGVGFTAQQFVIICAPPRQRQDRKNHSPWPREKVPVSFIPLRKNAPSHRRRSGEQGINAEHFSTYNGVVTLPCGRNIGRTSAGACSRKALRPVTKLWHREAEASACGYSLRVVRIVAKHRCARIAAAGFRKIDLACETAYVTFHPPIAAGRRITRGV